MRQAISLPVCPLLLAASSAWAQNQLILLSNPYSPFSDAWSGGLSPDGTHVAGGYESNAFDVHQAIRWSAGGSATPLGFLAGPGFSLGRAVSNGGSVVVGDSFSSVTGAHQGFRWTAQGGLQGLGFLPGHEDSYAKDISADGQWIVGVSANSTDTRAYRHSVQGGMQDLGVLPGYLNSSALSISADGSTIVGDCRAAGFSPPPRAFRWTTSGGMTDLGFFGQPTDVSANGTAVVGYHYNQGKPFRWTQSQGLSVLPLYDGVATAVSGNGAIVLGEGRITSSAQTLPFIWTQASGPRTLQSFLVNEAGLPLTNLTVTGHSSISSDGRIVAGTVVTASGVGQPFIAFVPGPPVLAVALVALAGWGSRRRVAASPGDPDKSTTAVRAVPP